MLPAGPSGFSRSLTVLRFGTPGARPKAYLQAGLHADELPGMLVLRRLAALLGSGRTRRNPGRGRGGAGGEPDRAVAARQRVSCGAGTNQDPGRTSTAGIRILLRRWCVVGDGAAGRRCRGQRRDDPRGDGGGAGRAMPQGEVAALRHALLTLAHDADIVLDLHADNEAVVHLYTGTPLWPDAADLRRSSGAQGGAAGGGVGRQSRSTRRAAARGGRWRGAFPRRRCRRPAWRRRWSCGRTTTWRRLVEDDARAILGFLRRRGVVSGGGGSLPRLLCEATPLDAMQQVKAPVAGMVVYRARLGDSGGGRRGGRRHRRSVGRQAEVLARTAGCFSPGTTSRWPGGQGDRQDAGHAARAVLLLHRGSRSPSPAGRRGR